MKGYFITGTDTGVGKTLVAGALAGAFVRSGKRVGVMKPFEAGCSPRGGACIPEDALFLKTMAACPEPLERICPYCLRHPLAPGVAAALEGITIDVGRVQAIFHDMSSCYDIMLVEGAGGLLVPVTESLVMLDVAAMLHLPLIIVARLRLGAINHTLLTVHRARAGAIAVAGIILNQLSPDVGKAEETSPEVIRRLSGVPVLGQMPFVPEEKRNDAGYLAQCAVRHIAMKNIN